MKILFGFFFTLLVAATPFSQAGTIPPHQTIEEITSQKNIDHVLFLMQKRLAFMHEVARTKWNQKLPIEDLPREQALIDSLIIQAKTYGLEEAWTRRFFQAQFIAAKMIQKNDFAFWAQQQQAPTFASVLDLKQEIRPYLDHLSTELLESLAKISPDISSGKLSSYILMSPLSNRTSDAIDEKIWQVAILPLIKPTDGS